MFERNERLSKEEKDLLMAAERYAESIRIAQIECGRFNRDRTRSDSLEKQAKLELAEELLEQRVGEVVLVKVVSVRTFGAVCQVLGTTRTLLLHVSELADEYIEDVSQYVLEGDTLLAMLILSKSNNRLALSSRLVGSVKRKQPRKEIS